MAIFKKMQFDSAEMEQMYNEYIGSICERNRFFQKFKVQQSLTIARQALEFEKYKDRLDNLPKDQVYITYCSAACDVSIDMAYAMAKMGFTKVYIFHGGWDEWKTAGYPAN